MTGAPGLAGASLVIMLDPHALKANSLKIHNKKDFKTLASVSTPTSTKAS